MTTFTLSDDQRSALALQLREQRRIFDPSRDVRAAVRHYERLAADARPVRSMTITTTVRAVKPRAPIMFKRVGGLTFVRFFRLNLQLSISRR
ncbi:hypothetical protein STRZYGA_00290 [Brevundimonas phage vB_BpoS-Strzyga]|nr:hypothetical protein STRZYGA_00290 [Brevundimonas phage vB_BpoS-Strzyga]